MEDCDHSQKEFDSGMGETVCIKCGLVLEEEKIVSQEENTYTEEQRERNERTGSPVKFSKVKSGFGSYMGSSSNISSNVRSGYKRGKYFRMNKWNNRVESHRERKLNNGRDEFRLIFADLNIPNNLKDEAMVLYIKSLDGDLINGRDRRLMCIAISYIVCRRAGIPRTLKLCAEEMEVEKQRLGQYYKYISRELDLDVPRLKPIDILDFYLSDMGLSRYACECREICKELEGNPAVTSRAPRSVVAGIIYYALNDKLEAVTQKSVSNSAGTTEVTIRKTYNRIKEVIEE